jgi:hypothetical protein
LATFWGQNIVENMIKNEEKFVVLHRVGADLRFLIKAAETILTVKSDVFVFLSGDENMPLVPVVAGGKKG